MSLEINLGERFGKLVINHEKSLPRLLEDLSRDSDRIKRTIEDLSDFPDTVKEEKGVLPKRILIIKTTAELGETRMEGYNLMTRELYAGEDGSLIVQIRKRPLKHEPINMIGLGMTNLEDVTDTVNPKFIPEWLTRPKTEAELRRSIKALFYS